MRASGAPLTVPQRLRRAQKMCAFGAPLTVLRSGCAALGKWLSGVEASPLNKAGRLRLHLAVRCLRSGCAALGRARGSFWLVLFQLKLFRSIILAV
jgi:hypothetical protein